MTSSLASKPIARAASQSTVLSSKSSNKWLMNAFAEGWERTRSALVIWREKLAQIRCELEGEYRYPGTDRVLACFCRDTCVFEGWWRVALQLGCQKVRYIWREVISPITMKICDESPSTCLLTLDARTWDAASRCNIVLDGLSLHATSSERKVDRLSTGIRTLKRH